jgi:hypothetical protein
MTDSDGAYLCAAGKELSVRHSIEQSTRRLVKPLEAPGHTASLEAAA